MAPKNRKKPSMKGKHLRVLPLWHARRHQGVLKLGEEYEIIDETPNHWMVGIGHTEDGQVIKYPVPRGHAELTDFEFSGDL